MLLGLGGALLIILMYIDDSPTASDASSDATSPAGAIGGFLALGLIGFAVLTAYRLRPAVFATPVLHRTQPALTAALASLNGDLMPDNSRPATLLWLASSIGDRTFHGSSMTEGSWISATFHSP